MNHLLRKATKPFKDEAQRKQNQTKEVKTSAELSSVNENAVLKCKLEAKCQALVILSEELLACKKERDEYRTVSEQLETRFNALRTHIQNLNPNMVSLCEPDSSSYLFSKQLAKVKDTNRHLLLELDDLKVKLHDSESDVKLLREELHRLRKRNSLGSPGGGSIISSVGITELAMITSGNRGNSSTTVGLTSDATIHELMGRSESISENIANNLTDASYLSKTDPVQRLVEQLEQSRQKINLLEKDMESVLDEKEELVLSRDQYKLQVEKLTDQFNALQCTNTSERKNNIKPTT